MKSLTAIALTTAIALFSHSASAISLEQRSDIRAFIDQMVSEHEFDRGELNALFQQVEIRQDILDAISRPAEGKPWHQYRPIFVTDSRSEQGVEFLNQHRADLERAEQTYGVPKEIITAIIGVETRYGQHKGRYRVVDALTTLGFDYPKRSEFFRSELKHFLLLAREEKFELTEILGSYAGAMGKPQFISSSYREYAVDFDGDGIRDLLNNPVDAIGSVANYLKRHGWEPDQPIAVITDSPNNAPTTMGKLTKPNTPISEWQQQGYKPQSKVNSTLAADLIVLEQEDRTEYWLGLQNFYAITRYNHSPLYAMAVYQLSEQIKTLDSISHQAARKIN